MNKHDRNKLMLILEVDSIEHMTKGNRIMKGFIILWCIVLIILFTVPIKEGHPVISSALAVGITLPIHIIMMSYSWNTTLKMDKKLWYDKALLVYKAIPVIIENGDWKEIQHVDFTL